MQNNSPFTDFFPADSLCGFCGKSQTPPTDLPLFRLKQTHSNLIFLVGPDDQPEDFLQKEGDALLTDSPEVLLGINTADCLPVLFYDLANKAIAAAHAGYKGLFDGVLQNTIQGLSNHFGSKAQELRVAIGPAICVDHYEFGRDLLESYQERFPQELCFKERHGHFYLDLKKTAQNFLMAAGVLEKNIFVSEQCTFEEQNDLYSYRRSKDTGRNITFIGLRQT